MIQSVPFIVLNFKSGTSHALMHLKMLKANFRNAVGEEVLHFYFNNPIASASINLDYNVHLITTRIEEHLLNQNTRRSSPMNIPTSYRTEIKNRFPSVIAKDTYYNMSFICNEATYSTVITFLSKV